MVTRKLIPKSAKTVRKAPKGFVKASSAAQSNQKANPARRHQAGIDEGTCLVALQTGDGAGDASTAKGHDHRRPHEGDRLAATFGPQLPCRRGQEEAQAQFGIRKGRRQQDLPGRQIGRGVMTSPSKTSRRPMPIQRRGRVRSAADHADRPFAGPVWRTVPDRPAKAFGPDLLRRSIAHRIQEKAYGGLSQPTRRLLDQLVKAAGAKPNGRLEVPRRIKPGSELVRTWQGRIHRVMVMAEGFAYGGKTFGSLSEIASDITGTNWNGPRFFGLARRNGTSTRNNNKKRVCPTDQGPAA